MSVSNLATTHERSKVIAEDMVRTSPAIRSLTVYRPSIVIDLHPTTSMRSDQTINSAFVMFQTLSKQFGLPERGEWFRRLGFGGEERKNIVTVDWVAAMIAEIYRRSCTSWLNLPSDKSDRNISIDSGRWFPRGCSKQQYETSTSGRRQRR